MKGNSVKKQNFFAAPKLYYFILILQSYLINAFFYLCNLHKMNNIAIFASGSGTNAEALIRYFTNHTFVHVSLVLSNKADAYVLERAKNLGVSRVVFNKAQLNQAGFIANILKEHRIHYIVLAGFLWLMPDDLLRKYERKILNIHPALLPKYGGKGMYGMRVHEAVAANQEHESGITIHFVDPVYDHGEIIFQAKCPVEASDTPEMIAAKVHQLEYAHYPRVVEEVIRKSIQE